MRNEGQVLSKEKIIDHVWEYDADVLPNNVEVFIGYLRRKVDQPFSVQILSIPRVVLGILWGWMAHDAAG